MRTPPPIPAKLPLQLNQSNPESSIRRRAVAGRLQNLQKTVRQTFGPRSKKARSGSRTPYCNGITAGVCGRRVCPCSRTWMGHRIWACSRLRRRVFRSRRTWSWASTPCRNSAPRAGSRCVGRRCVRTASRRTFWCAGWGDPMSLRRAEYRDGTDANRSRRTGRQTSACHPEQAGNLSRCADRWNAARKLNGGRSRSRRSGRRVCRACCWDALRQRGACRCWWCRRAGGFFRCRLLRRRLFRCCKAGQSWDGWAWGDRKQTDRSKAWEHWDGLWLGDPNRSAARWAGSMWTGWGSADQSP